MKRGLNCEPPKTTLCSLKEQSSNHQFHLYEAVQQVMREQHFLLVIYALLYNHLFETLNGITASHLQVLKQVNHKFSTLQ